jgi:hypothetical protein
MKTFCKTLPLIIIACFAINFASAQTTLTEYNYLTKGLKIQIESGLDMKKGYTLSQVDKVETQKSVAVLFSLNRDAKDGKESVIAAYLIAYVETGQLDEGDLEYICIPHPSSEQDILDKFWEQLYKAPQTIYSDPTLRLKTIIYVLAKCIKWDK